IGELHDCHWSIRRALGWTSFRRHSDPRRLHVADSGSAFHGRSFLGLRLAQYKRRDSEKADEADLHDYASQAVTPCGIEIFGGTRPSHCACYWRSKRESAIGKGLALLSKVRQQGSRRSKHETHETRESCTATSSGMVETCL